MLHFDFRRRWGRDRASASYTLSVYRALPTGQKLSRSGMAHASIRSIHTPVCRVLNQQTAANHPRVPHERRKNRPGPSEWVWLGRVGRSCHSVLMRSSSFSQGWTDQIGYHAP